jgi:hypothetical protein
VNETQAVVYLIVAALALAGTIGTAVLASRQKGLTDLAERLQARVEELDGRLARLESRDRAWANYVHVLRQHIVAQKPPPPPDYPPNLDV